MHINTEGDWRPFSQLHHEPCKRRKMNSALWCSISHLISYSRAVDGWYLPYARDFQYPEVEFREAALSYRMIMYIQGKKGRIAALKIEMYLWWESTCQCNSQEKNFEALILRNCACQQGNYFPKDTSVWLWGMKGQKGTGNFHLIWDTHAPQFRKRRFLKS